MDNPLVSYQSAEITHTSWPARPDSDAMPAHPALAAVLDEVDYGIIVLEGSGTITLANRCARLALVTSGCLQVRNEKLAGHTTRSTLAIERAILEAKNGIRQLIEIESGKNNTALSLSFAPLHDVGERSPTLCNMPAQRVIVSIARRNAFNTAALAEYGRCYRLTSAELRLLPAICEGASIKEIAKKAQISPCTVRVQLKNIRQKTGAASLRPLMLQLMTLPPMRSAYGN